MKGKNRIETKKLTLYCTTVSNTYKYSKGTRFNVAKPSMSLSAMDSLFHC